MGNSIKCLATLVAVLLMVPATASAAPATLNTLTSSDHHLTAKWTLPDDGSVSYFVEWADNNELDPETGEFLDYTDFADVEPGQTEFTTPDPLPSDTWYLHVATYDPETCDPSVEHCEEFSNVRSIKIDPDPSVPSTLLSAGQSNGHLTASWTLPPSMWNFGIEAATSNVTYPEGDFRPEVIAEEDLALPFTQTSWVGTKALPPGTYYLHVATFQPELCAPLNDGFDCLEFTPTVTVTIPASGGGAPVQQQVVADKVTSFKSLKAAKKQDVDKLVVQCSMAEAGTLSASGTVSVPGASKVYKFKKTSASATAGKTVKLKLKLPKKGLKAVKKALKRKKLKAKLTITAKDIAGNTKVQKKTVALTR